MQTLTFSCPLCNRRMGVGIELIGRPVRCPHCRQVVIAPSSGNPSGSQSPDPTRSPQPGDFRQTPRVGSENSGSVQIPEFLPPPRKEGSDSIFGEQFEVDEESVFEKSQLMPRPELPEIPESQESQEPTERLIHRQDHQGILETPSPSARTDSLRPMAPIDPRILFTPPPDNDEPRASETVNPFHESAASAAVRPEEATNPWQKIDPNPQPQVLAPVVPPDMVPPPSQETLVKLRGLLAAVLVYAVVMTILALWGWLRAGERGHPLLYIPDFFGEFRKAGRDKVTDLRLYPPFDQPVPAELKVRLGKTLRLGDLEVQPLRIEELPPVRVTEFASKTSEAVHQPAKQPALVLRMKIRNLSSDVAVLPMDPAFNRASVAGSPVPLSGLVLADGRKFMGGSIRWPFGTGYRRIYFEGQEQDEEILFPGKERETVLVSTDTPEMLTAIHSQNEPIVWQVHLRRGITTLRWEDHSICALFAVEFDPSEIQQIVPKSDRGL